MTADLVEPGENALVLHAGDSFHEWCGCILCPLLVNAADKRETLTNTLRKHGLMEYASIPWSQKYGSAVAQGRQKNKEEETRKK